MKRVFLVAFFKFDRRVSEYGFERIYLQNIFETKKEAIENMSFCDEAGWYEGAVIEERELGTNMFKGKRVWLLQQPDGEMKQIEEPKWFNNTINIIG
jgi:hypothetical protein